MPRHCVDRTEHAGAEAAASGTVGSGRGIALNRSEQLSSCCGMACVARCRHGKRGACDQESARQEPSDRMGRTARHRTR
jgi:hypothetical protein